MSTAASDAVTLEIPGLRLAAKAWGPADGLPTLALHGWLDNAASFDRLAPLLPECRVVAVDMPGHGLSDHRPEAATYHFVDWVMDVAAILEALGWQRCILIGHSMGGAIACIFAGTMPDRVSHLAAIEGLGPLAATPDESPERLARAAMARSRWQGREPPVYADRASAARRVVQATGLSEEAAAILVARGTREVQGGVTWRSDPRLRGVSPLRLTEEHVQAFLRRITAQSLLVVAEQGMPFDPELGRQRVACVQKIRVETLAGGHHVHLENPDAVAGAMRQLLKTSGSA